MKNFILLYNIKEKGEVNSSYERIFTIGKYLHKYK